MATDKSEGWLPWASDTLPEIGGEQWNLSQPVQASIEEFQVLTLKLQMYEESKETYKGDGFILLKTSDGGVKIVFPQVKEWENSCVFQTRVTENYKLSSLASNLTSVPEIYLDKLDENQELRNLLERVSKLDNAPKWVRMILQLDYSTKKQKEGIQKEGIPKDNRVSQFEI